MFIQPIGYFHGHSAEKQEHPRQASMSTGSAGKILLEGGQNFEQALEDLQGFEMIWVIFGFHQNENWKPKVYPPRGSSKRGLFATRSPHRPNPLGLSCLRLSSIQGRSLWVEDADLLDQSPIFDIKPYLPYCDSHPNAHSGWLEDLPLECIYKISYMPLAIEQFEWLNEQQVQITQKLEAILSHKAKPRPSHRLKEIKCFNENIWHCRYAYKTWRIDFLRNDDLGELQIICISSGYRSATLEGKEESKWKDVPLHQDFVARFNQLNQQAFKDLSLNAP